MAKRGFEQIKTPVEVSARGVKRRRKNAAASGMPATNRTDDDSELGLHLDRSRSPERTQQFARGSD